MQRRDTPHLPTSLTGILFGTHHQIRTVSTVRGWKLACHLGHWRKALWGKWDLSWDLSNEQLRVKWESIPYQGPESNQPWFKPAIKPLVYRIDSNNGLSLGAKQLVQACRACLYGELPERCFCLHLSIAHVKEGYVHEVTSVCKRDFNNFCRGSFHGG